jgi:uncharacterized protein (TIGR03067 family)
MLSGKPAMSPFAVLLCSAGVLVATGAPEEDAATADLKKMEGTWAITSEEATGRKATDEEVKKAKGKLIIQGDRYTIFAGGKTVARGKIRLDPAKQPKAIDITLSEGRFKDKVVKAIYRLSVDGMMVCYSRPGGKRPREFSAPKDSGRMLIRYRRAKR